MNLKSIAALTAARTVQHQNPIVDASAACQSPMSRRQFSRTAAGAVVLSSLGTSLWNPRAVQASGSFAPVPIPGGSPALGGAFHVFGPAAFDPIDAEPVTITNLNGFVGLAYISGMVTQTNTKTNQISRLPFVDSDMRFMQGDFRGADGRIHQGAFAFV
jgi:hypothetical protein